MPQMNPTSWLTLFFLFITIFIMTNSINYFYPNKSNIHLHKKFDSIKFSNWKW